MKNNYGNYVVQKALKLAKGENKLKLIQIILKNIEKIGDKKLIAKWKSIVDIHYNNSECDYNTSISPKIRKLKADELFEEKDLFSLEDGKAKTRKNFKSKTVKTNLIELKGNI